MVLVPAGFFIMGSDAGYRDERPRRRVYLDAYYIDKFPLTIERFRRFGRLRESFGPLLRKDRHPVVGITWKQANNYCRWIGKRLPTEAEWEKAERGTEGQTYPWGDKWDSSKVIWNWNSGYGTHPVDRSYLTHESPFGAVDMEGNVWGWTSDWYAKRFYRRGPALNPRGPLSGAKGVIRGCSWQSDDRYGFRSSYRSSKDPAHWSHIIGFRCAMAPLRP